MCVARTAARRARQARQTPKSRKFAKRMSIGAFRGAKSGGATKAVGKK